MITDPVADLITRIRNAQRASHKVVRVRASKMARSVLEVLKQEGWIDTYETRAAAQAGKKIKGKKGISFGAEFNVYLKYYSTGMPAISMARRVSTPGCRVYVPSEKVPRVSSGLGTSIISTSQGVMSDREARKRKVGGEVLICIG